MNHKFYDKLIDIVGKEHFLENEPMKRHTTFRVGGPAAYYITPATKEAVAQVVNACKESEMPYYIMGNGSNLLVSDKGFQGAVIQICKEMNRIVAEDVYVEAEAGALLSAVAAKACELELTGFEFAAGIPGTLGGACVMNAGAYGGEMKDVLQCVTVLDEEGQIKKFCNEEMELGYRTSIVAKAGLIVLSARIKLKKGERSEIRALMDELKERRITKQPLEFASAGSTFKRPKGYFAGKLIQDAGLRGYSIGGAQVSEKHCGFVINRGDATAKDIMELIHHVITTIEQQFGVRLETEVKKIGEF